MARIWMKTIKNHKIVENRTAPCEFETAPQVLGELLREADIARPLWLDKHLKEWARFQRTAFLPEHFVEDVRFDRKSNFCPTTAKCARARIRATHFKTALRQRFAARAIFFTACGTQIFINISHKNIYI